METAPKIDPRKLLSENHKIRARAAIIRMQIEQARSRLHVTDEEVISGMALSRAQPTGLPPVRKAGSAVEYVAAHYLGQMEDERASLALWILEENKKLETLLSAIRLYDVLMELMCDAEKKFIALHYDDKLSLNRIMEEHAQEVGNPHSSSTLKRMNRAILDKIDEVING